MDLLIYPTSDLNGEIIAPGSKSYSHRAFIIASLSDGVSVIHNPLTSGDVGVTIDILKALGVSILESSDNKLTIKRESLDLDSIGQSIDCKNSGTSLRIFSALSLTIDNGLSFSGEFLTRKRPITPLLDSLKYVGGEYELSKNILKIKRVVKKCDTIKIPGDISSQFITALLILASKLKCNDKNYIEIEITTPLVSYPYIKITLEVLKSFGIEVFEKLDEDMIGKYEIPCNQRFRHHEYTIPGDFSSAAFIIAAAVLSHNDSKVIVNNLNMDNPQGDKRIIDILREMGASIKINQEEKQVIIDGNLSKYPLKNINIDCHDIPDLFPILSVVGAFTDKTVLYNAANVRRKESDRIAIMARELTKMGVKVEEEEDKMTIYRCETLHETEINHENDHRIAMACCIAALNAESSSYIRNIDIVNDSYPSFLEDLIKLGVKIEKK